MKLPRSFLCLLVLTCLLQFTLPFHAVYAAPQDEATTAESALFGEKILLCTSEGFKWVSWAELQESEHEPAPHQDYECALCFAHSTFGKHIAADTPATLSNAKPGNLFHVFELSDQLRAEQLSASRQSRAPPAFTTPL